MREARKIPAFLFVVLFAFSACQEPEDGAGSGASVTVTASATEDSSEETVATDNGTTEGSGEEPSATDDDATEDSGGEVVEDEGEEAGAATTAETASGEETSDASDNETSSATVAWIDTHAHPFGMVDAEHNIDTCTSSSCLDAVRGIMDEMGIVKMILLPMPGISTGFTLDADALTAIQMVGDDRFVYAAGGSSLNGYIHTADRLEEAGMTEAQREAMIEDFKTQMTSIAADLVTNGAKAFGETAALHTSMFDGHAFEEVEPDHELFLHLVDLADTHDVPIDLHMTLVVSDNDIIVTPENLAAIAGSDNPDELQENESDFENLLAYADGKGVDIVWDHIGWDVVGHMTVEKLTALAAAHSNLYFQLRIDLADPYNVSANSPVDESGVLRPEWLAFFEAYPDRFVMGSDTFLLEEGGPVSFGESLRAQTDFLVQLPAELAAKIGTENAVRVYHLE